MAKVTGNSFLHIREEKPVFGLVVSGKGELDQLARALLILCIWRVYLPLYRDEGVSSITIGKRALLGGIATVLPVGNISSHVGLISPFIWVRGESPLPSSIAAWNQEWAHYTLPDRELKTTSHCESLITEVPELGHSRHGSRQKHNKKKWKITVNLQGGCNDWKHVLWRRLW